MVVERLVVKMIGEDMVMGYGLDTGMVTLVVENEAEQSKAE